MNSFFHDWRVLIRFGRIAAVGRVVTSAMLLTLLLALGRINGWRPSYSALAIISFLVFCYNWIGWALLLRSFRRPVLGRLQHGVRILLVLDGLALISSVYFMGGVRSELFPFALLVFLFANVLNPRRLSIGSALLFATGLIGMTFAESRAIIPKIPALLGGQYSGGHDQPWSVVTIWLILLLAGTGFIVFIRQELEAREHIIDRRNRRAMVLQRFAEEILDRLPVGIILLNSGGSIIRINPVAQQITGIGWPLEYRNIRHIRFFSDSGLYEYLQPVFQGQVLQLEAFPLAGTEGISKMITLYGSRLRFPEEDREFDEYFVLLSLQDVSQRRKLEEQTLAIHEQLLQTEKLAAIGQLAAGIAHELNNPLMGIISSADFLFYLAEKGTLNVNESIGKLEFIRTNAQRIDSLGRKLLGYVRPSRGEQQKYQVEGMLQDALGFVRYDAKKAGVELDLRVSKDCPDFSCEKSEIEQIMVNLVTNAIHSIEGREFGRVQISAVAVEIQEQIWLQIRVRDNGAGVRPDAVEHIWDPFFTTKGEGRGSGLGLPIVQTIVERYKGKIRLDTEVGRGTEFLIQLPYQGGGDTLNS